VWGGWKKIFQKIKVESSCAWKKSRDKDLKQAAEKWFHGDSHDKKPEKGKRALRGTKKKKTHMTLVKANRGATAKPGSVGTERASQK